MHNTTLSAIRRADQVYYEQISERHTLEDGLAFFSPEFPQARGDNAFREVLLATPERVAEAWAEVEAFYAARNLVCRRWVPCAEQDAAVLESFLAARGFRRRVYAALAIGDWPRLSRADHVRILPARAMRRAFRGLQVPGEDVELAERRLDYPQYDVFLATLEGQAVGCCGLFQAGEIAAVRGAYVVPDHRRRGIATALLSEVLALARRLMMRAVVAKVDAEAPEVLAFFEHCGFGADGELVEFDRG